MVLILLGHVPSTSTETSTERPPSTMFRYAHTNAFAPGCNAPGLEYVFVDTVAGLIVTFSHPAHIVLLSAKATFPAPAAPS